MPSSRWLKPAANSPPSEEPRKDDKQFVPNVSMSDVRRLALQKAEHSKDIDNEDVSDDATVTTPASTTVTTPVPATVKTDSPSLVTSISQTSESAAETSIKSLNQAQYLDATHSASEQRVYSVMYRETISKGVHERHYGPKELCAKTGIRSDRTVRMALRGLCRKLSLEVVSHGAYFPQGPRYRVYEPKEIIRRRRVAGIEIDPQTKKIVMTGSTPVRTTVDTTVDSPADGITRNYSSTGVKTTGLTPVEITGLYKDSKSIGPDRSPEMSQNSYMPGDDDDRLGGLVNVLREVAREVTGKEPATTDGDRWRELGEVLAAELRIAAARTTVSSVPSFLAEHLRRRLWKLDRKQAKAEGRELPDEKPSAPTTEQVKDCPDCGGTGMWYPEGYEKGVAKCRHERLSEGK